MRHALVRGRKTAARRFGNRRQLSSSSFERLEERRLLAVDAVNDLVVARANQVVSVAASYFQSFPTDAGTGASFTAAYPEFSGAVDVTSVAGGIVITATGESEVYWNGTIPSSNIYTISVDISGNTASPGSYNVGLRIGENNIVFHPGYGGGAFRVEGNGGFGNQTMPYTPANNLITNMQVTINKSTGLFTIVLTNSQNPAQSYTATFTNLNSVNGPISFHRSGPNSGTAIFDNLAISSTSLLANDTSASSLSPSTITSASGAAVTINADGTFSYDPRNVAAFKALPFGVTAADSFTYTAIASDGSTDSATVNVTVTGVNDLPVTVNDTYATTEDATLTVAAGAANRLISNDSDPDTGDVISVASYTATSALGASVVVSADGSFTYNPTASAILQSLKAGVTRVDTFTYNLRDTVGALVAGTASITVTGINDAPAATADTGTTTTEDAAVSVGTVLYEPFNTPAADAAAFAAAYPNLSFSAPNGGTIAVANGRVEITGNNTNVDQLVIAGPQSSNYTVEAEISSDGGAGSFNAGIRIGDHKIVFHPGYGGAAFRVEGTNGQATLIGNTNIGWTPALNTLHRLKIQVNVTTGVFQIWLTDGANANNVHYATVTSLTSAVGSISLVRSGGTTNKAFYDNLRITSSTVLDNDRDAEGGQLNVTQVGSSGSLTGTSAKGATVTMTAQGSYTYNPASSAILQGLAAGQTTTDTFTYTVADGSGLTSVGTVTITVTGLNDAPVANADTKSTNEDTPIVGGFSAIETFDTAAADTAAFAAAYPNLGTSVNGGVISAAGGRVEMTGNNSNFQQLVIAGAHPGETTVYFDVGTTPGGAGGFNVGLKVGDKNIVFHPGYTGIPGAFRVENAPAPVNGNTSMGFVPLENVMHHMKVHISAAGLVTISIIDGNNAANIFTTSYTDPAAVGAQISLLRQGPAGTIKAMFDNLRVTWGGALDNDRDADNGAVLNVTQLNGSATLSGFTALGAAITISPQGIWTYNPTVSAALQALPAGVSTTDSFTYTVSDGAGTSTATISIPVTGVNDAPIARNDSYSTSEDTVLAVGAAAANRLLANDSDVDTAETLTITSYTAVSAKGATVVINPDQSFTYNPTTSAVLQALAAGAATTDTFTYTITDSKGATATATVTVTVGGLNDAPVANSDTQSTNEDTPITGGFSLVEAFNTPAVNLAAFLAAYPQFSYTTTGGGSIAVTNGRVESTGPGGFNEQFVIAAGHPGETTIYADISADGSPGSFNVGIRVGNNKIVFHPGYGGAAFRVEGANSTGNQNIGWTPALNVFHHMKVHISPTGVVTVSLTDGSNPNNVYSLSYTDASAVGSTIALVRSGDSTSKGLYDNLRVTWGGALDNDRDADAGAVLTVSQLNGSATLTGTSARGAAVSITPAGVWTYNPTSSAQLQALPAGATVTDTFTYTVADGAGGTSTATITIPVTGLNDAPIAVNDSYSTSEDAVLSVSAAAANRLFANDTDVDAGDSFVVSAFTSASAKGAAVLVNADGSFTYNPLNSTVLQALAAGASTTDTFTYTIRDSQGATATATVTVTVGGLNDAPTFTLTTSSLTVDENTLLSVPNLASLLDADGNETLSYTIVWGDGTANSTGLATIVSTGPTQPTIAGVSGSHTYSDNATYNGLLTVVDSQGATITMPFVVTVVNVPPTASIDLAPDVGVPWMPLAFAFSATDPSPEDTAAGFTYTVNWGDNSGVQALSDPAEVFHTYTTKGTFTVTVIAYDKDGGASDPVTTSVTISTVATIDGVLYVGGTLQSDRIVISTGVLVRVNNVQQPKQAVASKIVVFGGMGADTISVTGTVPPVEFYGGAGDDYLAGGNFGDTLDGGAGKDRLIGGNGNDLLLGGAESDTLAGGNGNDTLRGGDMVDYTGGTTLPDGSVSLPGDIIPAGGAGGDTLNGDAGNDLLIGSENNDGLNGGAGNDLIRGMGGSDLLDGGAGDDLLLGDTGDDKLYGRAGRDALIGGEGRDVLYGSTSADLLFGDDVDDTAPDYLDAMQIWFGTWLSSPQTAFDDLTAMALEDGAGDTLYGETDADWYLMFTGVDKFGVSTENKAPNIILWL